jgi:twitching motility protein PilI
MFQGAIPVETPDPDECRRSEDAAPDTASEGPKDEPGADARPAAEAEPGSRSQRMGVRIGGLGLLFPFDAGREVIEPPAVSRIPNTASWLRGLANVRGLLVPVVDAAAAFDRERAANADAYLLILGRGENAFGLLIDGLPRLLEVDASRSLAEPSNVPRLLGTSVRGAYGHADGVWFDVELDELLEALARYVAPAPGASSAAAEIH